MKWKLETRKISTLTPHPLNPRRLSKHDGEHLQKSLDKFGLCEPIVINRDGVIIGGHQRVATLKRMGKKEVEVYVPERDLQEGEVRELNIRLNRNSGEWDFDILANGWDLDNLLSWGFLESDLSIDKDLLESLESSSPESQDEKVTIKIEAHKEDETSLKNQLTELLKGFERCKLL